MATYADFLKAQGATEDDVKLLDTPVARKAWDAQQKLFADADAARTAAEAKVTQYDDWWVNKATPEIQDIRNRVATAESSLAAEQARNKVLQEQGLIAAAATPAAAAPAAAAATPAFDASKYVTTDTLKQVAALEGDAIAVMADILQEHQELFPGQRITARELRAEAVSKNKSVEQVWMDKYNVPQARTERATREKTAYEKKIADDAVAAFRSAQGNPHTSAPMPSSNPFTSVPAARGASEQPWARNESQVQNDRVNKVLKNLQSQSTGSA